MSEQQQRMAAVETDKELSDLLDFSAMFSPPVANGKNRTMTLASTQFSGTGLLPPLICRKWLESETMSLTPSPQPLKLAQHAGYPEGSHYSDHEGLSSPFISSGVAGKNERPPYLSFGSQPGFLPSDIAMPSPDAMSPSGLKPGSQFYPSYPSNPRRRPPDGGVDRGSARCAAGFMPSLCPACYGCCVVLYGQRASFHSQQTPSCHLVATYMPPRPVTTMPETMEATPVQNQELFIQGLFICKKTPGRLLATPPCWDTLHTSGRLALSLLLTPKIGCEVNGFHSAPTTYNHTPTINGDGIMANRGTTAGSSGDEIGKALASIYPSDHNSNNFSSAPSTPGSPHTIAGAQSQWQRPTTPNYEGQPHALQSKMEDRLEEAIHVMRSHAVGQGPGLEGPHSDNLLPSVHNGGLGGLSPAFPNASLALSNRHPAMGEKHEEAAGLPPSSTLLHGHHASGPAPSVGQPEGFTSLPGGIARSTHSSSSSDIKREEKEDDDNLSDKTDDEKKDHKVARNR
ncbi:unnamed protein product, partial [Tetraodon nigroviridis]